MMSEIMWGSQEYEIELDDDKVDGLKEILKSSPVEYTMTMENPTINKIQSDRYKLIEDLVKWAVVHDRYILIREDDEALYVSISNEEGE